MRSIKEENDRQNAVKTRDDFKSLLLEYLNEWGVYRLYTSLKDPFTRDCEQDRAVVIIEFDEPYKEAKVPKCHARIWRLYCPSIENGGTEENEAIDLEVVVNTQTEAFVKITDATRLIYERGKGFTEE